MAPSQVASEEEKAIFSIVTQSKESDGLSGPGKLSTATEIYLYILQAASVQKAVVHDGYAISRPSQDFPFT